jgi:hypothetical protein
MKALSPRSTLRLLNPIDLALFLAMNMHAADYKMVFDFQTATNTAAWQIVNDDVMGGVSQIPISRRGHFNWKWRGSRHRRPQAAEQRAAQDRRESRRWRRRRL